MQKEDQKKVFNMIKWKYQERFKILKQNSPLEMYLLEMARVNWHYTTSKYRKY